MHAAVFGGGGFIGSHIVRRLKNEGFHVVAVDVKTPQFSVSNADEFLVGNLADPVFMRDVVEHLSQSNVSEIYQLAADMGGAGYIFTGLNDANVMTNSVRINLNLLSSLVEFNLTGDNSPSIFFSSSACIYPQQIQENPLSVDLRESYAYPANPDSEYGWEKLFSERLYMSYGRNFGIRARIGRYHNVYGPEGTFEGGREKAPAAICRKVALQSGDKGIEVWGDGLQTRSFLYISDCVDATISLTRSSVGTPLNIGSEEMVSINRLAEIAFEIAGKDPIIDNVTGPLGVRGRNSNNEQIRSLLGWTPEVELRQGMALTYRWVCSQLGIESQG